ncbi:MAG: hypothetical protein WCR01_10575 [Bacteroidota bacterium]
MEFLLPRVQEQNHKHARVSVKVHPGYCDRANVNGGFTGTWESLLLPRR